MTACLAYDLNARALYITLAGGTVARTCEADDNTLADLDADGGVLGVEVVAYEYPSALEDVMGWPGFPAGDVPLLRACFGEPADTRRGAPKMMTSW